MPEKLLDIATYTYSGQPLRIMKCVYIAPVENPEENDFLNPDLSRIFKNADAIIQDNSVTMIDNKKYDLLHKTDMVNGYEAVSFTGIVLKDNERVFAFVHIQSYDDTSIIMRIGCQNRIKAWLNGEIFINTYIHSNDGYMKICRLKRGDNFIVAEMANYKDGRILYRPPFFSLRISELYNGHDSLGSPIFKDYIEDEVLNRISIVSEEYNLTGKSKYEFMLLPNDFINLKFGQKVSIKAYDIDGNLCDEFEGEIGRRIVHDFSKILSQNETEIIRYSIHYNINKKPYEFRGMIQIQSFEKKLANLENKLKLLSGTPGLIEQDIINVKGRLDQLKNMYKYTPLLRPIEDLHIQYFVEYYYEAVQLLSLYSHGGNFRQYLEKEGFATIFYRSKLDDTDEIYNIALPSGYDKSKKYPLFIYMHIGRYSWCTKRIHRTNKDIPGIIVDVTCRGYTMGAYPGEASFFEIFNLVKEQFSIDEDRVYMIGFTSGAFAAWAMAQAHPHIFAGIAIVCGVPNKDNLLNLINIDVLNICADHDMYFRQSFENPREVLRASSRKRYEEILIKESDDNTLYFVTDTRYIMDWLLQGKRDANPKKVFFRTEKIRHNKAYWAEILEIARGKSFAQLEGEMSEDGKIYIKTVNVGALALDIPGTPRESTEIYVNGRQFIVQAGKDKLIFSFSDKNEATIDDKKTVERLTSGSKGMGVLDVYLDSMKILIPDDLNTAEKEAALKLADRLAHPKNRGWDMGVCVNYPVLNMNEADEKLLQQNNIVSIVTGRIKDRTCEIFGELPITAENDGFWYNGEKYTGEYCIAMILKSPFNPSKKLMLVCTNKYELFDVCLFTRNVIIPSYINGDHPYYCSDAIVYFNKKYLKVNEWSGPIVEI